MKSSKLRRVPGTGDIGGPGGVALDAVLATHELSERPSRAPNFKSESQALLDLAKYLATDCENILQHLVDITLTTLASGSAGVSLISPKSGDFYWPAVAGFWKDLVGGGTPRHFGPCCVVLERDAGQLFKLPEKFFPYLTPFAPICEALLAPFYIDGEAVGTVWVVAHDELRQFDSEDMRVLESLATFAACAYQTLKSLQAVKQAQEQESFMLRLTDALRPLSDPGRIQEVACTILGEFLDVSRVFYGEVDGEFVAFRRCFAKGVPLLEGSVRGEDYGTRMIASFRAGKTTMSCKVAEDPSITPDERKALESLQVGAYVGVPVAKDGEWISTLGVHSTSPRQWTKAELALIQETAERTWESVGRTALEQQRARDEERLRESEEFSRSLLESSPDCVKALDLDGRLLQMNGPGLCIMEVDDFEQIRNRDWWTLWPEDSQQTVRGAVAGALRGEVVSFESYCPTAKATPKWWEVTVSPVRDAADGQIVRLLSISRDITHRRQADEDLRQSEERFRMIADNMSQLAWTCDSLGNVIWYNRRWLNFTGLTFDEMRGWGWSRVQHPDHIDRVVARVRASAESGTPWEDTFPLRGNDGEYRWFLSRAVPIRDQAGEIVRWFGTNTDVTEQRALHEALRESEERLEEEVHLRTANLLAVNEQLQGFTYSVAHDLRQQIRGISNGGAMLLSDSAELLSEESQATLRRLIGSSKRLGKLVDDLLVYARLGKVEVVKLPLDLTTMFEEVAAFLIENGSCRPGTRFRIARDLVAEGDAQLVRIVLENLLDNACKYSSKQANPVINVDQVEGEFRVRDNGIGFDMRYAPKLFQPFERLHRDQVYAGTGIGLANVKRIIERHGGTVRAEGTPGEGAAFYFTLL